VTCNRRLGTATRSIPLVPIQSAHSLHMMGRGNATCTDTLVKSYVVSSFFIPIGNRSGSPCDFGDQKIQEISSRISHYVFLILSLRRWNTRHVRGICLFGWSTSWANACSNVPVKTAQDLFLIQRISIVIQRGNAARPYNCHNSSRFKA